ncbi:MAG TPA: hypothetical protein VF267_05260, partial [Gammaproteobacteria bacterium]
TVEDGIVTLVNQTYGLNFLDEDRLSIMGYMMKRLGETSDHNLTNPDLNERRLQRFWWQILIPAENTAEVMQRIKEEGIRYGREMDKILAEYSHIKLENNVQYVEIGFAAYVYQDLIEIEDGIPKDDLKVRSGIK